MCPQPNMFSGPRPPTPHTATHLEQGNGRLHLVGAVDRAPLYIEVLGRWVGADQQVQVAVGQLESKQKEAKGQLESKQKGAKGQLGRRGRPRGSCEAGW